MENALPPDLKIAYERFTLLALHYGYVYAAVMISAKDQSINCIGNVTERGHDLAKLLRMHADLIDDKTNAGQIATPDPIDPSIIN